MLYQYTYFNSVWTFIHISIIFTFGSLNIEIGILIKLHIYYFWNLQEKGSFWVNVELCLSAVSEIVSVYDVYSNFSYNSFSLMLILRKLPLKIKLRRKVRGRNLEELISFLLFLFLFLLISIMAMI